MAKMDSERIGFTVGTQSRRTAVEQEDRAFRIAILGDFSGGANSEVPLARRRPHLVDRDNFEEIMMTVGPSISATFGDGKEHPPLRFAELDDFHPDRLYQRLPVFRALRDLRRRLADPATFAEAAGALLSKPSESPSAPLSVAPPPADLLEQMLSGSEGGQAVRRTTRPRDDFHEYLKEIVAPHLVTGQDPRQPELLAQVDAAATQAMREILHHPVFQSLEAAWRSLYFLVRGLETNSSLQVFLVDATRSEIARDLLADDVDLESTALYKLFANGAAAGAEPWSVLVAAYTFGTETDDLVMLGRASEIAKAAGAPWIAAASPVLAGCPSFALQPDPDDWSRQPHGGWQALRELPGMQHVGLAAPRFLLRLPYGKKADECEHFAFEEIDPGQANTADGHEAFLWGNPAIACALLIGQAFETEGWDLRPGRVLDLDRLPQYLYKEDGETVSKPCAEFHMSERAADRISDTGIMPLASMKGSDRARLIRFQSIALPPAALAGPWTR